MTRHSLGCALLAFLVAILPASLPAGGQEKPYLNRDMPPLCGPAERLQVGRAAFANLKETRIILGQVRIGEVKYPLDPCGIRRALEDLDASLAEARKSQAMGQLTIEAIVILDGLTLTPFSALAYDSASVHQVAGRREIARGVADAFDFYRRLLARR